MTMSYLNISRTISRTFASSACTGHCQRLFMRALAALMCIALTSFARAEQKNSSPSTSTEVEALMARVGPPSQQSLDEFKNAGMEGVRPHTLTAPERTKVEAALTSLPALNRHVLEKRLHYLAFVDGIPGEGTGLTSPAEEKGLYDITLRASIVDERLSTFLTTKERRLFVADGSGNVVTVNGTGADALTYVLLHESTHVTDLACSVTTQPHSPFLANVWAGPKEMVPPLASSFAATTVFRGGHPIAISNAATLYDALAQTPFVSLYATASPREDFAELVAWHEVMKHDHGNLVIALEDARGKTLRQWEPLTFPGVQRRFADVDRLLSSSQSCSSIS